MFVCFWIMCSFCGPVGIDVSTCLCQRTRNRGIVFRFLRKCRLRRCYAKHGVGWWGCDVNVPCTCTHGRCYATPQRIGWGWGGGVDANVPCTCRHGGCYATHGVGVGWWGCYVNIPCTCDGNAKVQCAKTAGGQSNLALAYWCNRWLVETCKR